MTATYSAPPGTTIHGPHKTLAEIRLPGPSMTLTAEGWVYTFTYKAPQSVLDQLKPTWGATWPTETGNYPSGYYVSDANIQPTNRADLSILSVTLGPPEFSEGSGVEGRDPDTPTYGLEIAQLERPIESHPRYNGLDSGPSWTTNLQTEVTLLAWDDEEAGTVSASPSTDPDDTALLGEIWDVMKRLDLRSRRRLYRRLPAAAQGIIDELISKRSAGKEAYLAFYPVATIKKRTNAIPSVQSFGRRTNTPPFSGVPDDYEWLKTGGTYFKTGRSGPYESEEKSIGAQPWDEELYLPD